MAKPLRKAEVRLAERHAAHAALVKNSKTGGKEFRKPGSMQKGKNQ